MSIYGNNTPEMEPSKMPAIIAAAGVGLAVVIMWTIIGATGGAVVALINFVAIFGTYKLVRRRQLNQ